MQFNSYSYLLLLIPVAAMFWLLPSAWRRYYVLAVSLAFYASWNLTYTVLPVALCGMTWWCGRAITAQPEKGKALLAWGTAAVLLVLAFFKYRDFFVQNGNALAGRPILAAAALALPLGISFYSFEAISYLMDVRQGRAGKTSFIDLCLFIVFWPHLIAGPIVRVRELIPQFQFQKKFDLAMLTGGLDRLLWGLVQKNVIANSLGSWVDEGFIAKAARLNSTVDNWFLAVAFGLQIYFDFNAYSNMAIGTAQILGVKLPENFRMPYLAANPADFWARWHMTLSRWIRDYLFFPISTRFREQPAALYASLIGVMALVGLWHGAGWGFILWGTMHGVFLVLYKALEGKLGSSKLIALAWRAITLAAVAAAWIPFRAATIDQAATMLRTMFFGFRFEISYSINFYLLTLLAMLFCALEPLLGRAWTRIETAATKLPATNQYVVRPLVYASALLLFVIFDDLDTKFIYFQF